MLTTENVNGWIDACSIPVICWLLRTLSAVLLPHTNTRSAASDCTVHFRQITMQLYRPTVAHSQGRSR